MSQPELMADRLLRAKAGDGPAFAELLAPVLDPAFRLAITTLGDRSAAEDAVQEAALEAWRRIERFRSGADLRPWFLAIVANECRSVRRSRWWHVIRSGDVAATAPSDPLDVASADRLDLDAALSGELTPAFRARLSTALAAGRPAADARPATALVAAILLAAGTVAVLLVLRHGPGLVPAQGPQTLLPAATPSQAPALSPSPAASAAPAVAASPTVLASPIPLPTTAEFDAPSPSVVWALVGGLELFRSTDRGETWQQRPLPSDPGPKSSVSFVDATQGWLLSPGSTATQCQAEVVTIWHTIDAGATWQRMDPTGIADAQCKSALSFADPTHGFLFASDPNHPPVIYRTADGGRTWAASRPLPDPPGLTLQPGDFTLAADRVRWFGSTLLVRAGSSVFRSTDGGATWTYLASAPGQAASIAFVTATRWVSLIVPGQSEETADAGATWHAYASDYNQAAPVAPEVVFGDSLVGYATVRGGLQRTLDGGVHWSSLHTPGT